VSAFRLASRGIQQRAIDDPSLRGMATTAVAMLIDLSSVPVDVEDLAPPRGAEGIQPLGQPPGPKSTGRRIAPATGNATVPMVMGVPRPDLRKIQPDSQPGSQLGSQQRGQSVSALVAHVGDSRAYLWRDGTLEQVTRDHSWIEEQVAAGTLSANDARNHPWRNLVTRALGGGEEPLVELTPLALESGDRVLLCSDGLTTPLTDAIISEALSRMANQALEALAQSLVEAANTAGGPDNITVVIVEAS
jgi:serine/threonine protein phosphatase PrpC